MEPRKSDPTVPSIARLRPEAVTSVELLWRVPPPVLPIARPGVLASPVRHLPTMRDLTALVLALARETSLDAAVRHLQQEARSLLRLTDALCVWLDWPRRVVWSLSGRASAPVEELVLDVAGSGHRTLLGSALLEPLGPPPARAVLALRRSPGVAFRPDELEMIATLATGLAPQLDRLIARRRYVSAP